MAKSYLTFNKIFLISRELFLKNHFIMRLGFINIKTYHIIQSWVGHQIGSSVTESVYTTHNKDIDDKYINILNE